MNLINDFISKLSHRLNNENNLSDITWALAEASPEFKRLFLSFFFDEFKKETQIDIFKREHAVADCRPDFYIKSVEKEYIIEFKINDQNDHFNQYRHVFTNAQFGYISNYRVEHDSDIKLKQWRDFLIYLNENSESISNDLLRKLIEAYKNYVSNICGIIKLEKMNMSNLTSLYHFNKMIQEIVSNLEGYQTTIYRSGKNYDETRSGQYFSLKINDQETIYPWLGVYFCGITYIYIEISEEWCKSVYDKISLNSHKGDGEFFEAAEQDDESRAYMICLKEEKFKHFNDEQTSVEEQKAIIKNFTINVLRSLGL